MPPKFKFKREEIVEAAVNLTRRGGVDAVTARGIAGELGVSTQPVFTCFKNMEEAKEEVRIYAEKLCHNYLKKGVEAPIPFFGFGMAYIRFAKEEPELYKLLFINLDKNGESMLETLAGIRLIVINSLKQTYRLNEKGAKRLFRDVWLAAHSIATLCVGGICPYSDEEIAKILTGFSVSICKSIKEIKGFVDDNFDRDEVFGKIIEE